MFPAQGRRDGDELCVRHRFSKKNFLRQNLAYGRDDFGNVKMWYDEIKYTNNGLVTQFGSNHGHYTQVVWKGSTKLGCGKILVYFSSPTQRPSEPKPC